MPSGTKPSGGIVSICVTGFRGPNQALTALAHATAQSRHIALADTKPNGVQARFIIEQLEILRPRTVIFGGWSAHYEPFLQRFRKRGPFWTVYWTSSAAQMELSGELDAYLRVVTDPRIGAVLYADETLAHSALAALKPSDVLPVCLKPSAGPLPKRTGSAAKRAPVVSLFCSEREAARKNVLATLVALADVRSRYVLHLNGLSRDPGYRRLLELLRIPYRDFGWMERGAYERAVARVDLGLQVSLSESYNQVVADHGVLGIPVIASEMVPVLRTLAPPLRARLVARNPDDVQVLRRMIEYLLERPAARARIGGAVRVQLGKDNARNVRTAIDVLKTLA